MGIGYVLLSMLDILAIYNEIRSVVFNSLNLERATLVTRAYVQGGVPAIPNPQSMARHERIFLAPRYINHAIFRTISRTGVSFDRLDRLRRSFGSESFLVTWSAGVGTSIVLHGRAGEGDILKALLTWGYFVEGFRKEKGGEDAWEEAAVEALRLARRNEEGFVRALTARDWNMRQMVFGKIRHRTDW